MLLNQQQGLFGDKENLVNQQKTLTKEHEALYEKLSDLRQQLRATSPRNTTGTDCGTVFTSSSLEAHFSNLHVSPPSLLEKGKDPTPATGSPLWPVTNVDIKWLEERMMSKVRKATSEMKMAAHRDRTDRSTPSTFAERYQ
ncbi:hypothetical protein QOT17_000582 [Balamuthia mandrillaris]